MHLREHFFVVLALIFVAAGTIDGIEETSVRALAKLEQLLPPTLRRREVRGLATAYDSHLRRNSDAAR